MNKSMQTLLTDLRKESVDVATVISYLDMDNNVATYGLETFMNLLSGYKEPTISSELSEYLIKILEKTMEEKRAIKENEINELIVKNSYSHYQEVFTSATDFTGNPSIISNYDGKDSSEDLEYYAFHPTLKPCSFRINNLLFEVSPLSEITFTQKNKDKKTISYKYQVLVRHQTDPASVKREFSFFKKESLYYILGMSFLKEPETVSISFAEDDRIIITIDTHSFYTELAKKYNSYYSNLTTSSGIKFTELRGIEKCQFDDNGLILVPRLFLTSYYLTDGDLSSRPLVIGNNQGFDPVNLKQNKYQITIIFPISTGNTKIGDIISTLNLLLRDEGVNLNFSDVRKNTNNSSISCYINGYDQYNESNIQNQISSKLSYERKVSEAFRRLCQLGSIGISDFHVKGSLTPGAERYAFTYDDTTGVIRSAYGREENKIQMFFNRSSFTVEGLQEQDASNFKRLITDTNNTKFNCATQIMSNFSNGNLLYKGTEYTDTYSNYLATSFIPITFLQGQGSGVNYTKVSAIGLSFIPFGFAKYNSLDLNRSLDETAFAIYGSEFEMTPVNVNRVIKLSNDQTNISNIVQVVFKTSEKPQFITGFDLPLKLQKINDSHYIALFRSTAYKFDILNKCEWFFASEYTYHEERSTLLNDTGMMTMNISMEDVSSLILTQNSLLKFYIDTIAIPNNFKDLLVNNLTKVLASVQYVELSNLFTNLLNSDEMRINEDFDYLFKLVGQACLSGIPSKNILDMIYGMAINDLIRNIGDNSVKKENLMDTFEIIKILISSVQAPIQTIDYPYFSSDIQLNIRSKYLKELDEAVHEIYSCSQLLENATISEINSVSTSKSGIVRIILTMIADKFSYLVSNNNEIKIKPEQLIQFRNEVFSDLKSEASTLIFPNLVGFPISPSFIENASSILSPQLFSKLTTEVYSRITTDDYSEYIREYLEKVSSHSDTFVITQVSIYSYNVSFKTEYEVQIKSLNGMHIHRIMKSLKVTELKPKISDFGKYTYDPTIHCMFKVSYDNDSDLKDIITTCLKNNKIYYSRIGDLSSITDLSIVSIYYSEDELSSNSLKTSRFFIPFIQNNGKLTVNSKEWTIGNSSFNVESKICELILDFIFTDDLYGDGIETSKKVFCTEVLDVDPLDFKYVRSVCLGIQPIRKPFSIDNRFFHYIFTDDIKKSIKTDSYLLTNSDNLIPNNGEDEFKAVVNVTIIPCPSLIPNLYLKDNIQSITDSYKFFGNNVGKTMGIKSKDFVSFVTAFIDNIDTFFKEPYEKLNALEDEVMIITSKSGVHTKYYGNRSIESGIAGNTTEFSNYLTEINFEGLDELTNIDRMVIQEKIDLENNKIKSENTIYNLSLAMRNVKWESMKVDNYRFYSEEKPKWIKFSKDSYFMGVGFKSGVKIYIKAGHKYLFCNNLNHEGVRDIVFGNKQFCITTQYEDSSRPFGIIWVTTAGISLSVKLPYYVPIEGDAVNIKYITGTTSKEKKNVILEMDDQNNMKYGSFKVHHADPIFNHNVYFFSPDDKYLIYNKNGTFVVYDLNSLSKVDFRSVNGIIVSNSTTFPKCIQNGEWIDSNIFIGFTYANGKPLIKNQVVIKMENLSLNSTPVLSEYPSGTIYQKMKAEKSLKIHPLYSYLMNQREKFGGNRQGGVWVYDCFISFKKIEGVNFIQTRNLDGMYNLTDIQAEPDSGVNTESEITSFICLIIEMFEFSINFHKKIEKITWFDKIIFNRKDSLQIDSTMDQVEDETSLQYIAGNFFCFHGKSIYVWNYTQKATELTHIDLNGYERFIFDHRVVILVSEKVKVCIVDPLTKTLNMKEIMVTEDIVFDKDPKEISTIVRPVDKMFTSNIVAFTETTIEKYSNESDGLPLNIDTKIISSSLCLNRSQKYLLKSHISSRDKNENINSHDNLLIITNGREVKIIPKTVQVPTTIDSLNMSWYNTHDDEDWSGKKEYLIHYFDKSFKMFPHLRQGNAALFDMEPIVTMFKDRTESQVQLGFDLLLQEGAVVEVIETLKNIYKVFKNVKSIYNKTVVIESIREYESGVSSNENKINKYLNSFRPQDRATVYNEFITSIEPIFGKIFCPFIVIEAFSEIKRLETYTLNNVTITRSPEEIKNIISTSNTTDPRNKTIGDIIIHVLNIPLKNFRVSQIDTIAGYKNKLSSIKDELYKINQMICKVSKYDMLRAPEKSILDEKNNFYLKRIIALRSRSTVTQNEPDYILSLKAKYDRISNLPDGLVMEGFECQDFKYHYTEGTNCIIRIDLETKAVNTMRDALSYVVEFIKDYMISISDKSLGKDAPIKLSNLEDILGIKKVGEEDKNIRAIQIGSDEFTNAEILSAQTELAKYVSFLIKYKKTFGNINEFFTFIEEINLLRFPDPIINYNKFYSDFLNNVVLKYNVELPEDTDIDNEDYETHILPWNIHHVEKTFFLTADFISRGYFVSDGTYNETYDSVRNKLVPILWKYRNGVSDSSQVPVLAIKLIFPRDVKYVKDQSYIHSETKPLKFEYSIPSDDVLYGIENGIVEINLVDLISGFDDRSIDYSEKDVFKYYDKVISSLEIFDSSLLKDDREKMSRKPLDITKKILPATMNPSSVKTFASFRDEFRLRYKTYITTDGTKSDNPNKYYFEAIKKYRTLPQLNLFKIDIKYSFEHSISGVDFGDGEEIKMIYSSKHSPYTGENIINTKNISYGAIKPIDFDPKPVTKDGSIAIFSKGNSEIIVWYGNTIHDGKTLGFIILQDLMTRETTLYHYIKKDKRKQDVATYIVNITQKDNGSILLEEKITEERFENGKHVEMSVKTDTPLNSFANLMLKMSLIEGYTNAKFQDALCESVSVKKCENLYAVVSRYRSGAHYGSVAEIFDVKGSKIERINSWNFHMYDIKDFDITSKALIVLGSVNGYNGMIAKLGVMNIKSSISSKQLFVKVFDHEIVLANPNVEILSNCNVIAGKTSYVTFKSKHLNHLVVFNDKKHYESRFVSDITSVSVSRESGYVGIYFQSLGKSEVWTCNGQLYEVVDGECNWL
uniref:Uncharacterized protein n=1 Tax=viral metagenome TaxID=1070528 RepID=A0A6C0BCB4_9ZZZZ